MAVIDALHLARARISKPGNWTADVFARDAQGEPALPTSDDAVCWCALGALNRECDDSFWLDAFDLLNSAARSCFGDDDISVTNDTKGHSAVLKVYDAAIAAAEAEAR